MKKKIYNVFGVTLALVLVFSLAGAFLPADQAEAVGPGTTANRWQKVSTPSTSTEKLRGGDIADMAVAGDSETIYAITGLGALTAIPSGDATAVWSTTQENAGSYSAKLHAGYTASDWAKVTLTPPEGITLANVAAATTASGYSWWYYIETLGVRGTSMELFFRSATDSDGWAEMTIMDQAYANPQQGWTAITGAWTQQTIVGATTKGIVFGVEEDGTAIAQFPDPATVGETTVALMAVQLIALDANAGAWVLTEVRPTLGWIGASETTAYVDDVTIANRNYDLEQGDILVTDTNGLRWDVLTNPGGTYAAPARLITVAPDDPNAIAIVDSSAGVNETIDKAAGTVWISNNGGTTWAALSRVPAPGAATTGVVTDIAIGPARSGTIMGRDYVVTVADTTGGTMVGGDVLYLGFTTDWVSCAAATALNIANTYDFTSVAISPGVFLCS